LSVAAIGNALWMVAVRTRETIAEQASAVERYSSVRTWSDEPSRLVCAGLVLALVVLALRIASVW
jgi:hypothetical protein